MTKPQKTLLTWALFIAVFVAVYYRLQTPSDSSSDAQAGTSTAPFLMVGGLVAILVALVLFVRRAQQGGQNLFTMRKTTARLLSEVPKVGFADVGGAEEAKSRLGDVVDFLKNPDRWRQAGARLPRGVLLEGPPGCGKTLLARALAGEAKAPFFEVSASEFVELLVGVGPARVRDLFEEAGKKAPAIIFIDELDAIGRRRGSAASALLHVEYEQTLNQLLVCMDGFKPTDRVVVVAATNRGDVLDAALVRPGRFDLRVEIPPPALDGRLEVLRIHTKDKPLASDVDLRAIAEATDGYTGAELENLANEAALSAARRARQGAASEARVGRQDFTDAIDRRKRDAKGDASLDAILHESQAHLMKPRGRMAVRVVVDGSGVTEGELVWASPQFFKLRVADGREVMLSRANVRQIEALPDARDARRDADAPDVASAPS